MVFLARANNRCTLCEYVSGGCHGCTDSVFEMAVQQDLDSTARSNDSQAYLSIDVHIIITDPSSYNVEYRIDKTPC